MANSQEKMRDFRKYDVWIDGMDIVDMVYESTKLFPKSETFALCDQIQRAAVSIPSNIAEGCSRSSELEFAHFLEYSIGSCFEVETQIEIALRRAYIKEEDFKNILLKLHSEERKLNQFISKLKQKQK